MKKLLNFSANYPWPILITIILITALASTTLSSLKIQISAESLIVDDDPAWIAQQQSMELFGDSDVTVVLFKDKDLFTTEKLHHVKKAIDELDELPGVIEVTSLFSVANIKLEDDTISNKAFLEEIPETEEELQSILKDTKINPLVINNLINDDGSAFAVNLTLDNIDKDPDFEQKISRQIEEIITSYHDRFDNVVQVGLPYIRDTITKKVDEDQRTIMPWSIAILAIALAIGMRSFTGAIIPLFTSIVSIILTLAGMALLEIPISVMTSIVPALIIIVGSTEDIHIIAEYKGNRSRGMLASEALSDMSNTIGIAILLTFITTYFGFVSIATNEINLLKEFGLVASTGLLLNFIITSLSVPAILKITTSKKFKNPANALSASQLFPSIALAIFDFVLKHKRKTIAALVVLIIWSVIGALQLQVNNNPLGYFKEDTEVVKNVTLVEKELAGIETFSIILETGIEGTFKKARYLEEVEKLQKHINETGLFDKALSFNDYLKMIHLSMDEGEAETIDDLYLPNEDYLISEYLNFIDHDLFKSFVNKNYNTTRILVRHSIYDSNELRLAITELETFIEKNIDPALRVKITGSSIVSANGADYMAAGQGKSLLLMSIVIIAVLAILFVTWKAGVVALIPNLMPVLVLFGVMGHFNIPLDTGTAMVAVIALGICVDDTVHFMTRYHHRSRNRDDPEQALRDTVVDESIPIFTTSFALILGFMTFAMSSFIPIIYFGWLSALVMLLALITTFILTPLLLSFIRLVTMWDMLSLNLQAKVIEKCHLFKDFSSWQIKQTILASELKHFTAGQYIIQQGTQGDEMYVILEGDVDVKFTQDNGSVITVNQMSEGAAFGEIALVSKAPRSASVVATNDCRLLSLKWSSIEKLSKTNTRIAVKLFHNLASSVGRLVKTVDNLTILRDETSGFLNRTMFEEILELELLRSQRYKEPLSFIGVTLLFSTIDDSFNKNLMELAKKLRTDIRNIDVIARWSDQRFIILLPRTPGDLIEIVTDRINRHLGNVLTSEDLVEKVKIETWYYDGNTSIDDMRAKITGLMDAEIEADDNTQ